MNDDFVDFADHVDDEIDCGGESDDDEDGIET